ncbi:MAG: hypothetical protein DCC58_13730 [Chloroflexi bacterium]|nr:MAG: hypothetical protein DCC58_13730 [Chloroflexota bacterium]
MHLLRRFVTFWVDFIVGDAWEVALGIAVALAALWFVIHSWGGQAGLGFVLLAVILGTSWIALIRATAHARNTSG